MTIQFKHDLVLLPQQVAHYLFYPTQRVVVFVPFQIDVANREVGRLVVASLDNCTLFCNTNLKRKKHKKQKKNPRIFR